MKRCEILALTIPEITTDESSLLESSLRKLAMECQGDMISFEKWGKYKLAYPVKGSDYGVYFLARFDSKNNNVLIEKLRQLLAVKYNELVMRFVCKKLDASDSLEYVKPESLEDYSSEGASTNVDSVLSENFKDSQISAIEKDVLKIEKTKENIDESNDAASDTKESSSDI